MKPKPQSEEPKDLFQSRLEQIIWMDHPLVKLAEGIDWKTLEVKFGEQYHPTQGAPGNATRLMVGLHYLKYTFDQSDEGLLVLFVENPYWQYFCGFEYFQHEPPIHPTSMTKWRNRVGEGGAKEMLQETIRTAQRNKLLRAADLQKVNVDTTVQEKNISYPTDPKLYLRALQKLVRQAKLEGVSLRQSYTHVSKKVFHEHNRLRHGRKPKQANKKKRKLRTFLGRLIRDIRRKHPNSSELMRALLSRAERIYHQQRTDKHKMYSVHEPQVDCISKGKAHKKYEFGCKVSYVTTSRSNFILGAQALHGNPYDGHTLQAAIAAVEANVNVTCKKIYCDRGYRGLSQKDFPNREVYLAGRHYKGMNRTDKKWLRRRAAIEPVIGHLKSDHRLGRNFLQGAEGDKLNAVFSAAAFNFKKLLNFLPENLFESCERSGEMRKHFRSTLEGVFAIPRTPFGIDSMLIREV